MTSMRERRSRISFNPEEAMYPSIQNTVALVTGGSAGIGRATALAFAREGARVVVADVADAGGEETVRLIRDAGGEAVYVHADVSRPHEVEAMVGRAVDAFDRLDYAFNNAGIEGEPAATAECSEENWDRVLGINLRGVWLCMRYQIPQMLRQGGGAIVNCSSVAGLVGFAGSPAYVASKHGVVGLTKTAALDYATQGIRVNAVCPGVIRTAMIERYTHGDSEAAAQLTAMQPVGRMGTPEEIADAVLWLCSDGASFVTGQAIAVDGGLISR
jgi:NAD(P)-dependent dehydrogenase (short-subunit alcohol dehydrogenase family)